jgi:hypothetical protein
MSQIKVTTLMNADGSKQATSADVIDGATKTKLFSPFSLAMLAGADAAALRSSMVAAKSGANADITSLTGLTTPLSVAQGGTGVGQSSRTQIEGLVLRKTSAGVVTVGVGSAYVPFDDRVLTLTTQVTVNLSGLVSGTFYHFYLYNNAGTTQVELTGTAPQVYLYPSSQKTSDNTRRYIGSILASGTSDCYNFVMMGDKVLYNIDISSNTAFNKILGGRATTSTAIDCSTFAPATATTVILHIGNNHDTGAACRLASSDIGALGVSNWSYTVGANPGSAQFVDLELLVNSSLQFNYMVDAAGSTGGVYCRGRGYYFNR